MTEPLATVPKGESAFRVIQDGSFDGAIPGSSINSRQLGRPRMTMCTAAHFLAMLTRLRAAAPPGARIVGFKTDINAAYPTLRLSQDDPPVHFATYRTATGQFALVQYRALKFGNAPSCGFFSRVQLVFLGALRRETLRVAAEGPWSPAVAAAIRRVEFCGVIDDVAYLVEDVAATPIHQTVLALHEAFRFPLNTLKLLIKGQPGQTLTYSGISVDLAADRLFLDDKRRAKWAAKLRLALAADRISSERAQSIHGIMQRVALVFVLGKAWLYSIRRLLAVASQARPERGLKLDQEQRNDIQLYIDYLSRPAAENPPAPALTRPGPRRTARLVSDASFRALCGAARIDGTVEFWVHQGWRPATSPTSSRAPGRHGTDDIRGSLPHAALGGETSRAAPCAVMLSAAASTSPCPPAWRAEPSRRHGIDDIRGSLPDAALGGETSRAAPCAVMLNISGCLDIVLPAQNPLVAFELVEPRVAGRRPTPSRRAARRGGWARARARWPRWRRARAAR